MIEVMVMVMVIVIVMVMIPEVEKWTRKEEIVIIRVKLCRVL